MTLDHLAPSIIGLIRRFFQWWGAELAACVPAWLRLELPWAREDLVLLLGPREAVLGRDRPDGRFEPMERIPLAEPRAASRERGASVRLRLGGEAALRLGIPLPPAALENLEDAVAFQLDRYTPFLPEQVYIACAPGEREEGAAQVTVATTVVERRAVADAVALAQHLGFAVTGVEVARGEARERAADLLKIPELRRRPLGQFALTAAAAVLLLALGAAAVTLPFAREEARAGALSQLVAAARAKAEAAQRLETEIAAQEREANFLVDRKRARASALDILAALTRIAPDDTWLSNAMFDGKQVQISGLTSSASGLVGRFEKSDLFRKAEFRSPVTPDPRSGHEHFVISAELAKGGAK
jgi:general secretion pathway protein L